MRGWIYKRDEAGKPRRFLTHGEAAWWSFLVGAGVAGAFALPQAARFVLHLVGVPGQEPGGIFVVLFLLVSICAVIFLLLYLYIALSGGVMDKEARRRYRNNETMRSR